MRDMKLTLTHRSGKVTTLQFQLGEYTADQLVGATNHDPFTDMELIVEAPAKPVENVMHIVANFGTVREG